MRCNNKEEKMNPPRQTEFLESNAGSGPPPN